MDTEERKRARNAHLVARAEVFNRLARNEDWQIWKKEVADARLSGLREEIVRVDRHQSNWREVVADKVAAYQEIATAFDSIFRLWKVVGERAQEELNKLNQQKPS